MTDGDKIIDPIEQLEGRKTEDGWTIKSRVTRGKQATGGAFSVGYIAEHDDGRTGFLKALDFRTALKSRDPMAALKNLTTSFVFERDVLELCRNHGMDRVVRAIGTGFITQAGAPMDGIYYLVFELAEGDVRGQSRRDTRYDLAWSVAALHHIAVGLQQLHRRQIFHQDVKPSNILVFAQATIAKLADLGRAHCTTLAAPHDILPMPGARTYAPPEQLYKFEASDRGMARQAADLYLLGSMIHFLVAGIGISAAVSKFMRDEHLPASWGGTFPDVLPYYRAAYVEAIKAFEAELQAQLSDEVFIIVGKRLVYLLVYLTDPEPNKRGHPKTRQRAYGNPFDLERFVAEFDIISRTLAIKVDKCR